jgi:PAS domain S-box-containing protein
MKHHDTPDSSVSGTAPDTPPDHAALLHLSEALEKERIRNEMVLGSVHEGLQVVDATGVIIFENPAALALLGFQAGELIGRCGHDIIHYRRADGSAYPQQACPIWQTLQDGQTRHIDSDIFIRRDGSPLPVEYTVTAMRDSGTAITGAVVAFHDITERLREQRLRLLETQVLDKISQGQPLAGILEEITRNVEQLIPDARASVLLIKDGRMYRGAAPSLPEPYNTALEGTPVGEGMGSCGTAAFRRELVVVPDTRTDPLWRDHQDLARLSGMLACWSLPILDVHGEVLATFAMYHEQPQAPDPVKLRVLERVGQYVRTAIERSRQRDLLLASEERFRIIVQSTNDVVWDWNLLNDQFWWSDGIHNQFGHDPRQLPTDSRGWRDIIHPDDLPAVEASLSAAIDGNATEWQDTYRLALKAGGFAQVQDRGRLLRDETGRAVRAIGAITDITERKRLEAQLRQSQRLDAIGQLTGGIAHDFNNLLTVILGSTELLKESLAPGEHLRELAEMAFAAAERGAELTSRLLAFARRQPLSPSVLDINALIIDFQPLLKRVLGEQVVIRTVLHEGLWAAVADAAQLENAILNLAINARDAMPGGGQLTIETMNTTVDETYGSRQAIEPGRYVRIAVTDNGAGMDTATLSQVFEPFFSTKEVGKGSGLGLSMVYGFVTQSHGYIRIYSEPGQGTTVRLYFPRDGSESPTETSPRADGNSTPLGTETILLVEDNELVRGHVAELLRTLGYHVLTATNGPEAMAVITGRTPIDLLFTDVVMPAGMSGTELAQAAHGHRPDLKVLFSSGYTNNALIHQGRLAADVHLLQKPYRRQELAQKVRLVLDETST